jgi:RNA polymerase sigma-70 factor (ECF subfamily)
MLETISLVNIANKRIDKMEITDEDAITRLSKGEIEAFTELYDKYVEKIYNFIFYRVSNRALAEDLTSEVFLRAFDRIETFNPEKSKFSTWLFQIAKNRLIDYYRAMKPLDELNESMEIASDYSVIDEVDKVFDAMRVKAILDKLESNERDLIIMRLWDDLSYREITELTGRSEASLKMHFSRIMKKLTNLYE